MLERSELTGLHGPTVSRVYGPDNGRWYAVTVFVNKVHLTTAVDHFRAIGGVSVTVSSADYIFHQENRAYQELLRALDLT